MMRDRAIPEGSEDTLLFDVTYEIYLKQREEPINFIATFEFRKENIRTGHEVEDVMQMAVTHLLATIDVVREHRFILSNERFTKGIFLTEEIQAVSILSPDEDTILRALEG